MSFRYMTRTRCWRQPNQFRGLWHWLWQVLQQSRCWLEGLESWILCWWPWQNEPEKLGCEKHWALLRTPFCCSSWLRLVCYLCAEDVLDCWLHFCLRWEFNPSSLLRLRWQQCWLQQGCHLELGCCLARRLRAAPPSSHQLKLWPMSNY